MAEYFETEAATRDFDSRIALRILSYLKPYRAAAAAALAALAVSTAGELVLPMLMRSAIDDAILVSYRATEAGIDASSPLFADAAAEKGAIVVEGRAFVPAGAFRGGSRAAAAIKSGRNADGRGDIFEEGTWYAFAAPSGGAAAAVVASRPELFVHTEDDGSVLKAALPIESLASLGPAERLAVRASDVELVGRIALAFLAALAAVLAATFAQTWATTLLGQRVMKDMRLALFDHAARQSLAFLSRHPVGRIVTRLTGDVETINEFFSSVLSAFLKDLTVMVGVFVAMFLLSPGLALAALATLPPVAVAVAVSRVKARDAFRSQRAASSRLNAFLSERLSGVQVVQLFSQEEESGREFRARSRELLRANLGEMYVFATFRPVIDFLASFSTAVVILAGAYFVSGRLASLGVLIAFVSLVGMFFSPVQDIAEKYTLLQSAMAGAERVFSFLDADDRIPDRPRTALPVPVTGAIEFDDVRFAYRKGEEVVKGLSFKVEPGEMVAVVGYTGAGKTTLINLLTRLWDVDSGEIRLDGIPVKDLPLADLRRSVLPVLQDVFLFAASVADNIRLGLDLSDEEVERAARAVHAHDFVSRLPQGYATMLSEGADNISSGQRQLISFARVIAHDPRIVVLDEATSSVDTETERLVQDGLGRILAGRTSLVIAHRLSTIRHADRILVLSGGVLAEQGRHDDLMRADGLYAELYRLQFSKERG